METDPQTISAYLIYLSQHAPVEEQAAHNDLALVMMGLVFILMLFFIFIITVFFFFSPLCRMLLALLLSVQPS